MLRWRSSSEDRAFLVLRGSGWLPLLALTLSLLFANTRASGADDTTIDWDLCHFETSGGSLRPVTSPAMAIKACTSIIESGLESGQNLAVAYVYRGDAYATLGQTASAFPDYDQAATLLPDADYAYVHRGQAYLKAKQTDRALEDFNKALALKPDSANTLYLRGVALVRLGQNARAIEDADRALALHPNDAATLYLRCGARLRAGTALDGALEDCDAAIRSAPGDADMVELRAWLQLKLAHLPAAEADFTKVLALKPNTASALWGRHLERERAGDQAGSTADLNAALTIDPRAVASGSRFGMVPEQHAESPLLLIMVGVFLVFRLVVVTAAILTGERPPLGRGAFMVRALPLLLIGYVLTAAVQSMQHGPVISGPAMGLLLVGLVPDFLVTRLVIARLIDIGTTRWRSIYWVAIPSVLGIMALVLCFVRSQPPETESIIGRASGS
jgi:tetratricopeptide (TPR) repeat protein